MRAPDSFVEALANSFRNRLRIRWSAKRGEFHIEQQVGQAALPPARISEGDDDSIRARDGYAFVLAVRSGDRMPCPEGCGATLRVPIYHCAEIKCERCRLAGRDGRHVAGFFPLTDRLITYLRSIDPETHDPKDILRGIDSRNAALEASRARAASNEIEATTKENFTSMFGIESVGYTGKTFTGNPS